MTDRTTALRVVYGAVWLVAIVVGRMVGDGAGLLITAAGFVLALLLWPSVKPGVRTLSREEASH